MNKIEKAIHDTNLHIKDLERQILILNSKLTAYKDQLETLEIIKNDNKIKNE